MGKNTRKNRSPDTSADTTIEDNCLSEFDYFSNHFLIPWVFKSPAPAGSERGHHGPPTASHTDVDVRTSSGPRQEHVSPQNLDTSQDTEIEKPQSKPL